MLLLLLLLLLALLFVPLLLRVLLLAPLLLLLLLSLLLLLLLLFGDSGYSQEFVGYSQDVGPLRSKAVVGEETAGRQRRRTESRDSI